MRNAWKTFWAFFNSLFTALGRAATSLDKATEVMEAQVSVWNEAEMAEVAEQRKQIQGNLKEVKVA